MNTVLSKLGSTEKFLDLQRNLESSGSPVVISGLVDVGISQVLGAIYAVNKKPVCVITYNEMQAKKLVKDLSYYTDSVIFFPKKEIFTYDYLAESKDLPYERIEALQEINRKKAPVVVTSIEAVMQKLPEKSELFENLLSFHIGKTYSLDEVKSKLLKLGFVRYDLIEGRGQFSIRGGIVDISINENTGIRIEFWGDEVDSIRAFHIMSQRSFKNLDKAVIYPAHEYIFKKDINKICNDIKEKNKNYKERVQEDIELIQSGNFLSKIDKYFDSFYERQSSVLEYLPKNTMIFFDEFAKIKKRYENIKQDRNQIQKALIEKEKIVPDVVKNENTIEEIKDIIQKNKKVYLEKQDETIKSIGELYHFSYREINFYQSELQSFCEKIEEARKQQKDVTILVENEEKAKKLQNILAEKNIPFTFEKELGQTILSKNQTSKIVITIGSLSTGFSLGEANQIVIVANDLVEGNKKRKYRKNTAYQEGEKVVFADLQMGDYVVHKNYGIGIYVGVNTITADGTTKDYIKIKYKNDDILYVPISNLDMIRKYVGGEAVKPKINRIGGKDWENTKTRVKNNLREVAKDLIELYAKREKIKGFAFSKDTPWQREFESKFPYQETDDQLRCIEEVKKDMEEQRPMDRLLCGDVGYGKTEVAIRAAFKAVMDQKQVAYLVPTTVLAEQQYESFKQRMETYPIKVEVLNRFKTKKKQDEIVKKVQLGEVDVLIGTHRILSKDVNFKDLGLLIIDEEHRFGVKDKEKIKKYKESIDVLTMTATPIPRTLHMSIVGIRDMSVIYEPPQDRKPVQTYVLEQDEEVIKEAITKELERGGQVFYLFNNVEKITKRAEEISNLVPEAKVSYAHGRMTGTQVENIMQDFIIGKTNVLVCTTILESGIDIPNANTILVENAERMGLAQLYQIRGRVR